MKTFPESATIFLYYKRITTATIHENTCMCRINTNWSWRNCCHVCHTSTAIKLANLSHFSFRHAM